MKYEIYPRLKKDKVPVIKKLEDDIVIPFLYVMGKYRYSPQEQRILMVLYNLLQDEVKQINYGNKQNYTVENLINVNGGIDKRYRIPTSYFLSNDTDQNHSQVKKALRSLRNKTFEYERVLKDEQGEYKEWTLIGWIEKPKFDERGFISFELPEESYTAMLQFVKGYKTVTFKTIMSFNGEYTGRFYQIIDNNQTTPLTFNYKDLKERFGLAKNYNGKDGKRNFINRVIIPSQQELNEKCEVSFTFENKRGSDMITFFPVHFPDRKSKEKEENKLLKQTSSSWDFSKEELNLFITKWKFDTNGINNNRQLFRTAKTQGIDLLYWLKTLDPTSATKTPQGMFINFIKKELDKIYNLSPTPSQPTEELQQFSHGLTHEEILNMTAEQYDEYKRKQREVNQNEYKGMGTAMREFLANYGKNSPEKPN